MLRHQKLREVAPEMDALKMGTNCTIEDLEKPHILVESSFGDSHPGSVHLDKIVAKVVCEMEEKDMLKPFKYFTTDICDGQAQGHRGMSYSLPSRELITGMVEAHANVSAFDGAVFIASCDKVIPAYLIAMCRLNIPSLFLSGGIMGQSSRGITLEEIGKYNVDFLNGKISESEFLEIKACACPTPGACSFLGTATTMQIMASALGLSPLTSAMVPTGCKYLYDQTENISEVVQNMIKQDLTPRKIVTEKAVQNAIVIHAAISGSTNTLIHLPAICNELGIKFDYKLLNSINDKVSKVVNIRPNGIHPGEYFWYAGGLPKVMDMVREHLDLSVITYTGNTLEVELEKALIGEQIEFGNKMLIKKRIDPQDVLNKNFKQELASTIILEGNLAPLGAVIKTASISPKMYQVDLKAKVFESEKHAFDAIITGTIEPYTAIIVKNEGAKANAMPEMFYTTEALANSKELSDTCALITDGRFSGASKGPVIGHVSPEAVNGGPISKIIDGDVISIDLLNKQLNILVDEDVLEKRESISTMRQHTGFVAIYQNMATDAMNGAQMQVQEL